MHQQGQTIQLKSNTPAGERLWAYRYRVDGRGSRRVQQGGFATQPTRRSRSTSCLSGCAASEAHRAS